MGIIQKQALRTTIINFAGSIFGSITRLSMPLLLSQAQIGLLQILDAISGVFMVVFSLGFEQILFRMFPRFRNEEEGHYGFLAFGIILSLIGVGLSFGIYFLIEDVFINKNDPSANLYKTFSFLVFPLIFFRILFNNLDGYAKMLFNSVIGVFLDTFLNKFLLAIAIITLFISWITFDQLVYIYVVIFCVPGIIITVYAFLKTPKITFPHKTLIAKKERKNIFEYIFFGVLLGGSGSIVRYVDSLMINKLISLEALGIYAILFFAARLLVIPSKGISRISNVIVAESWEKEDKQNIQDVYEKSCLNQLLIGAFLFGLGWACIHPVLSLSENLQPYADHVYVFFFLGIGLVVEMATGINNVIIGTSEKYKFNTYFGVLLAILVAIFNFIFIKIWSIEGAAVASMFAMIIINFLRWFFIYKSFGLQPFNGKFFKVLIISVLFISLCHFVDFEANAFIKIGVFAVGYSVLFWTIVVMLGVSEDINKWLKKMKNKFLG